MKRPLVVGLLFLSLAAGVRADEPPSRPIEEVPPPAPAQPPPIATISKDDKQTPAQITPAPALKALLGRAENGFTIAKDGSLSKGGATITVERLKAAGLVYDAEGRLVHKDTPDPVEDARLIAILNGLLAFSQAEALAPGEAGKKLRALGLPPQFDGVHILNPDGSATYYGQMLIQTIEKHPASVSRLSGQRLSSMLRFFAQARAEAFDSEAPQLAHVHLKRAWSLAGAEPSAGETPLRLDALGETAGLAPHRATLQSAVKAESDPEKKKRLEDGLAALNALERQRYHRDLDVPGRAPPPPGSASGAPAPAKKSGEDGDKDEEPAYDGPRHKVLPELLDALDRASVATGGRPLTSAQQEWLVKSFPLGEVAWRMGAPELWRQGLRGQGVKVAIVDSGAGRHPELAGVVTQRPEDNFTKQYGRNVYGEHGTHVAGIIHSIAPQAQIRSYVALSKEGPAALQRTAEDHVMVKALRKAVDDGAQIVSISMGGKAPPDDLISRTVQELSGRGVIFVIAAGNEGANTINGPSNAPAAVSVGALDVNGRATTFTSAGAQIDADSLELVIKPLFFAPGENVRSTLPGGGYGRNTGTSMATPAASGSIALLVEQIRATDPAIDPITLSSRVRAELEKGPKIRRDLLPYDAEPDQPYILVDPVAAYRRQRPPG